MDSEDARVPAVSAFGTELSELPLSKYVSSHEDGAHSVAELLQNLQSQLSQHTRGLLADSRAFLPDAVVHAINDHRLDEDNVIIKRCDGAVVSTDATGFSALTERLAVRSNGAELLSKCLNRFFTPLIDTLTAYSGDVIKFSGEALTILFASTNYAGKWVHTCGSPSCTHLPLELACIRAAACCIEIHKRLNNFDTGEGDIRLTLHIGVGAGNVTIFQVGGHLKRWEYGIAGHPLEQIAVAQPLAGSGETVLSPHCWRHVADYVVEGPPVKGNPDYHRLKALDNTKHTYPTVKQAARVSSRKKQLDHYLDDEELELLLLTSMRFIPRSLIKQFRTGSLRGINEMRNVSIFFVKVNGIDISTDEGASKGQELMLEMQSVCYSEEGNLNKFLVDDKGVTFLFVFGLPPLVHIDDPTRACRACLEMSALLKQMELTGHIGVATGRAYCGLVGSDTRRQYTVMGETVNLSARLTAHAEANTVLVDEATYKRCQGEIVFSRAEPLPARAPSKEGPIRPYRPLCSEACVGAPEGLRTLALGATAVPTEKLSPAPSYAPNGRPTSRPPLVEMKSWASLATVHEAVTRHLQEGNGLLIITGESGCGKQEVAESVLKRCRDLQGMMPYFGSMQIRTKERWAAPRELISGLLRELHHHSHKAKAAPLTDEELRQLLDCEDLSNEEAVAVKMLFRPPPRSSLCTTDTDSKSLPTSGVLLSCSPPSPAKPTAPVLASSPPAPRPATPPSKPVTPPPPQRQDSGDSLCLRRSSVGRRNSNGPQVQRRFSTTNQFVADWALDCPEEEVVMNPVEETEMDLVCKLACRLLERLARRQRCVVMLRCWRGTTLSPCDTSVFWKLAQQLGRLAQQQPAGQLLVLVVCRTVPWEETMMLTLGQPESRPNVDLSPADTVVSLQPLTDQEAEVFTGSVMGVGNAANAQADSVPPALLTFLRSIALNNPRNIQEALVQLQDDRKIAVQNQKVQVLADLRTVDVAEWVHTSMVGNLISQIEMMSVEAERVIKMATVLDGPFSALDIASVNRGYRPASGLLALHDSVHLLLACEWLVSRNFLKRFDCGANSPEDQQSPALPRWEIANLLIRKVVGATLLQSQKILMKRTILVSRALNLYLPARMRMKAEMKEKLFGQPVKARKIRRSQPCPRAREVRHSGLPSSCIVRPVVHQWSWDYGEAYGDFSLVDEQRLPDWLHLMCAAGNPDRALQLLDRYDLPVDMRDAAGLSPLHLASSHGQLHVVEALLRGSADPTALARGIGTPLELAAKQGHLSVVKVLAAACEKRAMLDQVMHLKPSKWRSLLQAAEVAEPPEPKLHHGEPGTSGLLDLVNWQRAQVRAFLKDNIAAPSKKTNSFELRHVRTTSRQSTAIPAAPDQRPSSTCMALQAMQRSYWATSVLMATTMVAVFGPDVCVIMDGSQALLDKILVAALCFLVVHILLAAVMNPSYSCTVFFVLDVVGTASLVLDISWLLGPSLDEPFAWDHPLDGRPGSCNGVVALLARGAELGNRSGQYPRLGRLINLLLCLFCMRPGSSEDFGGVEVFRQQIMRKIATHVAGLTVLLVVTFPLMNYMALPAGDLSMVAWITILSQHRNLTTMAWHRDLLEFERFYEWISLYGPYYLCTGKATADGFECAGNIPIWGSDHPDPSRRFTQPLIEAEKLVVRVESMEAIFDFSMAMKREAWMNMALVIFAFTVMMMTIFFISRTISDLVLRPMQRMLMSVQKIAPAIFGGSSALGLDWECEDDEALQGDEVFALERIVQKLGKIAGIVAERSGVRFQESFPEGLTDEDRGVLQLMFKLPRAKTFASALDFRSITSNSSGGRPSTGEQKLNFDRAHGAQLTIGLENLRLSFDQICTWHFDVTDLKPPKPSGVAGWLLLSSATDPGLLKSEVAMRFVQALEQNYHDGNIFHNWLHATDVLQTTWMMMHMSKAQSFLRSLDRFALLVSAISHDVGHPGVNNQFLVETGHELALRYNDRSPLENMHCAMAFRVASGTPGANVFESLTRGDFFEARQVCIEAILHTDMVHHFDIVKEAQMLYQMHIEHLENDRRSLMREKATRQQVLSLLLHVADISNPCKPWSLCQAWSYRCLEEFFAQGDKEKELSIPVQMLNDRTKVNRPLSQIGFIEFMIVPLESIKVKLFPQLFEPTQFLLSNIQEWHRLWVEEVNPSDEEREKVARRVERATDVLTGAIDESQLSGSPRLNAAPPKS